VHFTQRPDVMAARGDGDELRVGFAQGGWGVPDAIEKLDADTWSRILPPGSTLEVATYSESDEGDPPPGLMRFRGTTAGEGGQAVFQIAEAFPPVTVATLRDALALAEAANDPQTLTLRTPEEAENTRAAFIAQWGILVAKTPPVREGAVIRLGEPDARMMFFLATEAFRARYAETWPHFEEDDD
jgi:hypothetical protein